MRKPSKDPGFDKHETKSRNTIPRDRENDYTREAADRRRTFLAEQTGASLEHVASYSFDPEVLPGNIENFVGVAQVPLGVAGPIRILGESAQGDFFVPLATSEGTLVASYNRGMRLLTECGGVKTTVVAQSMQRAPVFICEDARQARDLGEWLHDNFARIKQAAEATTSVGQLNEIEQYPLACNLYTRFNFFTGDAAGQNMSGKAAYAACEWIVANYPEPLRYILSGSMDTDKKHSLVNVLQTRGRRVVAEAVIKRDALKSLMNVTPEQIFEYRQISQAGGTMAGAAYSGAHAANALAALFIATGQDAANVSESHAGITYAQLLPNGDYYWSVTLPALIVGSFGGGTGLPTQRECLEMLGCVGAGRANKLAEICAAVVLAGDISLTSAVLAGDWVSSHDKYGRNRK